MFGFNLLPSDKMYCGDIFSELGTSGRVLVNNTSISPESFLRWPGSIMTSIFSDGFLSSDNTCSEQQKEAIHVRCVQDY